MTEYQVEQLIAKIERLPRDQQKDEFIKLRELILRECDGETQQKLVLKLTRRM